jgi:curved DNA-binding protein CbpA
MKDFYAILEVPPTASQEAIREQYLFLIQAWHPDKFPKPSQKAKAEEKCKQINLAYDVLGDARKRDSYDRELGGRPSPYAGGERHQAAAAQPARKPAAEAQWRQAEAQKREPADAQQVRADSEAEARETEEWIRVFFEQARRRKAGQAPVGPNQGAQHPIRVLVVADQADTRARMHELLRNQPDIRLVGEVRDGLEATRQFDALMPDVTTVYTNLPSLNAISATEAIRRKYPMAKVIVIGIQGNTRYVRQAAMAGACDYLIKPPAADQLLLAIRLAAARGAPASEKAAAQ